MDEFPAFFFRGAEQSYQHCRQIENEKNEEKRYY